MPAAALGRLIGESFTGVRIILADSEALVMRAAALASRLGAASEELVLIAAAEPVGEDVRQLTLVPSDAACLPSHPPGSHLGLIWQPAPARVNCYSLTGDGDSPAAYTVSVLRVPADIADY